MGDKVQEHLNIFDKFDCPLAMFYNVLTTNDYTNYDKVYVLGNKPPVTET